MKSKLLKAAVLVGIVLAVAVLLFLFIGSPKEAKAADTAGFNAVVLPGDLAFGAGGLKGRYIILEDWSATEDYAASTFIRHSSQAWVALTDPAVGDEPGTASAWLQLTGTGGGGTTTFLGNTDTPNSYTGEALTLVRVNSAATGLEFIPEPSNANTIPHVGHIPDATADSPLLIILTNNEYDGNREDPTFTVAVDANNRHCGFSDGEVFPAYGSISKESPIASIYGVWNSADSNCDLSNIYSFNEGFISDITRIVGSAGGSTFTCDLGTSYQEYGYQTKRITSCSALEDLATGDITINLLDANGDAYWLDGDVVHSPGLYVKLEVNGMLVYHDVTPPEDAHKTGRGSAACGPANPPTAPGQICVADGRGYFAMIRTSVVTTDPEVTDITPTGVSHFYPGFGAERVETDPNAVDGDFVWLSESQEFYQRQGTETVTVTWAEAWAYVIANVADTAFNRRARDSTFLGEFTSEIELARDRDGYETGITATATATISTGSIDAITIEHGGYGYTTAPTITIGAPPGGNTQATATATITDGVVTAVTITEAGTGYTDAPTVTFSAAPNETDYFFIFSDFFTLLEVTGFDHAERIETDDGLAWRGPVIISEEVLEIIEANPGDEIDKALDSITVGSQVYSVIVRAGANHALRDATAADFDATIGKSRVVGWAGEWLEVYRTLISGHSASASDNIHGDGDEFSAGGHMWRYRDEHHGDSNVHGVRNNDFYFDLNSRRFRVCPPSTFSDCTWRYLNANDALYQHIQFLGYFDSRELALAHATSSGQSAVYLHSQNPNVWRFNTFSSVVPGQPNEYVYDWRSAIHLPVNARLPDNPSDNDFARYDTSAGDWVADSIHTGSTIGGDGTLADPLVVNVHDVITASLEHIRWHTDSMNTTTKGGTICNIFTTGPYQYSVTHTSWNISGIPENNMRRYRARLYTLNDNNTIASKLADSNERDVGPGVEWFFYFDSAGIVVPSNTRTGVCLSRTIGGNSSATYVSVGIEDATSPTESYSDADMDWIRHGWGEYETLDPQTGNGTETHDTDDDENNDIYGEMRIYYKRTVDHGDLVGDGTVDLQHLHEDVVARLLPASPDDGDYARYNETDSVWEPVELDVTAPSGARIRLNADESVTVDTATILPWDETVFDDCSCWNSTNASRLTVPQGYTRATIELNIDMTGAAGSTDMSIQILKNGTDVIAVESNQDVGVHQTSTQSGMHVSSGLIPVASGDYFEARFFIRNAWPIRDDASSFSIDLR